MPLYSDPGYSYYSSSGGGLYSPYYSSSYGSSSSSSSPYAPYSSTYNRSYNGTYSLPSTPRSTQYTTLVSRYQPKLSTITESPLARSNFIPLTRIQSPKVSTYTPTLSTKYISSRPSRPKTINTADIDVSASSRYGRHHHMEERKHEEEKTEAAEEAQSITNTDSDASSSIVDPNSPFMPRVDGTDTGHHSRSTIKRNRAVVRLSIMRQRSRGESKTDVASTQDLDPSNQVKPDEPAPSGSNVEVSDPLERFYVQDKAKEECIQISVTDMAQSQASESSVNEVIIEVDPITHTVRRLSIPQVPSFHDICEDISSDKIDDDLNAGVLRRRASLIQEQEMEILNELQKSQSGTIQVIHLERNVSQDDCRKSRKSKKAKKIRHKITANVEVENPPLTPIIQHTIDEEPNSTPTTTVLPKFTFSVEDIEEHKVFKLPKKRAKSVKSKKVDETVKEKSAVKEDVEITKPAEDEVKVATPKPIKKIQKSESGEDFWSQIGTRESLYMDQRRKNLEKSQPKDESAPSTPKTPSTPNWWESQPTSPSEKEAKPLTSSEKEAKANLAKKPLDKQDESTPRTPKTPSTPNWWESPPTSPSEKQAKPLTSSEKEAKATSAKKPLDKQDESTPRTPKTPTTPNWWESPPTSPSEKEAKPKTAKNDSFEAAKKEQKDEATPSTPKTPSTPNWWESPPASPLKSSKAVTKEEKENTSAKKLINKPQPLDKLPKVVAPKKDEQPTPTTPKKPINKSQTSPKTKIAPKTAAKKKSSPKNDAKEETATPDSNSKPKTKASASTPTVAVTATASTTDTATAATAKATTTNKDSIASPKITSGSGAKSPEKKKPVKSDTAEIKQSITKNAYDSTPQAAEKKCDQIPEISATAVEQKTRKQETQKPQTVSQTDISAKADTVSPKPSKEAIKTSPLVELSPVASPTIPEVSLSTPKSTSDASAAQVPTTPTAATASSQPTTTERGVLGNSTSNLSKFATVSNLAQYLLDVDAEVGDYIPSSAEESDSSSDSYSGDGSLSASMKKKNKQLRKKAKEEAQAFDPNKKIKIDTKKKCYVKEEAPRYPLVATPRPLWKREKIVYEESSNSSSEETESESECTTSDEYEDELSPKDPTIRMSTCSNDSGFDGGTAPSSSKKALETSYTYLQFQKSGRITAPATTIPRFKKYSVEDFHFLAVLGKGSFGKVLLAELRNTDFYYAVKCLKKDVVLEDDDVECTLIERKVLALGTKHPYLCHLFCTFQTESHLFFVMEYLNGGDLMFHIQESGRFPEDRARFYGAEIISGLKFLHKKGIIYRDLKLDNVLLDFDGHVRIADFGMCKLQIYLDKTADSFCGTPDYMAPEIIKGDKYNQNVDWWSFGVLLYEMLIGQSPFSGCDEDELFWSICNEIPWFPVYITQEATSILKGLLEKDYTRRVGSQYSPAGDICDHIFFKSIDWGLLEKRQLTPPFKPQVKHPLDTQYFDRAFTRERVRLTPIDKEILQSMDQEQFQGFSYTNPNATLD